MAKGYDGQTPKKGVNQPPGAPIKPVPPKKQLPPKGPKKGS